MIYKKITNKLPTLAGILLTGMIAGGGCGSCGKKHSETPAGFQGEGGGISSESYSTIEQQKKDIFESELCPSVRKEKIAAMPDLVQVINGFPLVTRKDSLSAQFGYGKPSMLSKLASKLPGRQAQPEEGDDVEFSKYILSQNVKDLDRKANTGGVSLFEGMASDVRDPLIKFITNSNDAAHTGSIGLGALLHIVQSYNKASRTLHELSQGKRDVGSATETLKQLSDGLHDDYKITRLASVEKVVNKQALYEIMNDVKNHGSYEVSIIPATGGPAKPETGNIQELFAKVGITCTIDQWHAILTESGFFNLLEVSGNAHRLKMNSTFVGALANTRDFLQTVREYRGLKAYEDVNGTKQKITDEAELIDIQQVLLDSAHDHYNAVTDLLCAVANYTRERIAAYVELNKLGKVCTLEEALSMKKGAPTELGKIQKFFARAEKLLEKHKDDISVTDEEVRDYFNNPKASPEFKKNFQRWSDLEGLLKKEKKGNSSESPDSTKEEEKEEEKSAEPAK